MISEEELTDTFLYMNNVTIRGIDEADHDRNVEVFHKTILRKNITLNDSKTVSSVTMIDILGYCISHNNINLIEKGNVHCKNSHYQPILVPCGGQWERLHTMLNGYHASPVKYNLWQSYKFSTGRECSCCFQPFEERID